MKSVQCLHLIALTLFIVPLTAHARDREWCVPVTGKLSVRMIPPGADCESPVACTVGTVRGGVFNGGKTKYVIEGADAGPTDPYTLVYAGKWTVSTKHGTLTLFDEGLFSARVGLDSSHGVSIEGSGRFRGVKGHVFFFGTGTQEAGLKEQLDGQLCFPLGDWRDLH